MSSYFPLRFGVFFVAVFGAGRLDFEGLAMLLGMAPLSQLEKWPTIAIRILIVNGWLR